MKELFSTYRLPITSGVLGLMLAVLRIATNFFKTLLILVMATISIAIGFYSRQTKILGHCLKS